MQILAMQLSLSFVGLVVSGRCQQRRMSDKVVVDDKQRSSMLTVGATVLNGRFEIIEMIGFGGYGQIYRATDKVNMFDL